LQKNAPIMSSIYSTFLQGLKVNTTEDQEQ